MSAVFTRASVTRLINGTLPTMTAPFATGFWFNMATSGNSELIWSMSEAGADGDGITFYKAASSNVMTLGIFDSGGYNEVAFASGITSNKWHYATIRLITSTNRRASIWYPTGAVEHVQNTASRSPANINALGFGGWAGLNPGGDEASGRIAEYFLTSADIQGDGGVLQASTLRALGRDGPFAMPHLRRHIIEYRSFLAGLETSKTRGEEAYWRGSATPPTWTNYNGVKLGAHVPLPGGYRSHRDYSSMAVI